MKIIPKPTYIKELQGEFVFSSSTKIVGATSVMEKEIRFLDFEKANDNKVEFRKLTSLDFDYMIKTDPEQILITSATEEGLFHGAMTLKQLVLEYYKSGVSYIPCFELSDSPVLKYRGYMLDISRHFFNMDTLKKLADILAYVKMNVFHLHLSDNQGFRLESKVFPLLNEIGSKRSQTLNDGVPVEGYYTQEEMKEFISYCNDRHITIVPEIDLPGHTLEILASYPELGCVDEKYEVGTRFKIDERILCGGNPKVYEFCYKLLDELCDIFPSPVIHIGGDEVPKARWKACPKCQELIKTQGLKNEEELQGYFTNKMAEHVKAKGKRILVWNEAAKSGALDKDAMLQFWFEVPGAKYSRRETKSGRKTIVSRNYNYYLDYSYGVTSLYKTFNFNPLNLICGKDGKENIVGIEAPLWTEWVPDEKKLFTQTFPRLFAVAERGWAPNSSNYYDFKNRLFNVLDMMQVYEYDYTSIKDANPWPIAAAIDAAKFQSQWLKA